MVIGDKYLDYGIGRDMGNLCVHVHVSYNIVYFISMCMDGEREKEREGGERESERKREGGGRERAREGGQEQIQFARAPDELHMN